MKNQLLEQRIQIWKRRVLIAVIFCLVMGTWWGMGTWLAPTNREMATFGDFSASLLSIGLIVLGMLWFYKPHRSDPSRGEE